MFQICTLCHLQKPHADFHISNSAKSGRQSRCKLCANRVTKDWYEKNSARAKAWGKEYYANNRDARDAANKHWIDINQARRRQIASAYNSRNKESVALIGKQWIAANPELMRQRWAYRRALKKNRTPVWANPRAILDFYITAEGLGMHTGERYEVDHIVPLQSKFVCGLHCEANLQILSIGENRSKSNRHWPDMPA